MTTSLERAPAVAGAFYPADPAALRAELERCFAEASPPGPVPGAIGCMAPHAGYMFSGVCAAHAFGRLEVPRRVIVLGPNHTGLGPPLSVWPGGRWRTPLGPVEIDTPMVEALSGALPLLEPEPLAHVREHAIEVEVPFLQYRREDFVLTPIVVGTQNPHVLRSLGEALAVAVRAAEQPVLLVASSDMNHYEDEATTQRKDALALERLEAFDPAGLLEVCARERISMCGLGPTVAVMHACRALGAVRAEVVDHRTSAAVSGDTGHVVGYAAALFATR
ncbi:MAG: AmmeMemoRadiSam system protein B [Planctomycetota bacterium]|nr:MAG: AmmeMemoRadiSam system protein B [Planctomycetota bacterium]